MSQEENGVLLLVSSLEEKQKNHQITDERYLIVCIFLETFIMVIAFENSNLLWICSSVYPVCGMLLN